MRSSRCRLAGFVALCVVAAPGAVDAQRRVAARADVIFTGGRIFTADPARPWATAIAIRGDRILAVGTDSAIGALATSSTRRIALAGRVVVPGFNDAHLHVGPGTPGEFFATGATPQPDPPFSVVLDSVRALANHTPPGTWIMTEVAEKVLVDPGARRAALDRVAPRHPVYLRGWSGHGAVFNSAALIAANVDTLRDPVGGWIERDASGRATGRVDEYALFGADSRISAARDTATAIRVFTTFASDAAMFGITSAQNMSTNLSPAQLAAVERAGVLQVRHALIPFEQTRVGRRDAIWNSARSSSSRSTIAGVKWVLDGTPVERLALMREPYADKPGWYGRANFPLDTLKAMLRDALRRGKQPMLHAVGDSTIALLFTAMRSVAPDSTWRRIRPRIEHGDNLMPDQFAAAKALGIVVVQNPSHLSIVFRGSRWSDERASKSEVLRGIVDAGIPLAIGSDGPLNPFLNLMFASLNPANPGHALTREQAVVAYTRTAAYAQHAEREKGTLAPGMLADLAVLSQDIFTVPPEALPGTTSVLTMVGGRVTRDVGTGGVAPR